MAMWSRGGNFFHQRLSKLYSDTKQSYESAKVVPAASPNIEDNPDVIGLRKEFTIQQDRLLAWGMHWADVGVQAASSYMTKGQDVNIDKKIDQAGLGDLVASVMEEIKRLLDESGKLSHPERYELSRKPSSPRLQRKEWKEHEVQTGRALLDQLKGCIDVLYSLVENQKQEREVTGSTKDANANEAFRSTAQNEDLTMAQIFNHPLYIDFATLSPMHDPDALIELPSYSEVRNNTDIKARSIYFYATAQSYVIVDMVPKGPTSIGRDAQGPLQQAHDLADKLSGRGLLSWDGHLKLLGFTLASANSCFGFVYALPVLNDPTALPKYQTLSSTVSSSSDHDISIPPLEDRFRLAYNIALLATAYLSHGSTHGYINSANIMLLPETEHTGHLEKEIRCPYLLQPIKKVTGLPRSGETLQESMYHHPDAGEQGYGSVAAHDIYSVGVVLLELGLWTPMKKLWKAKYDRSLFYERLRRIYSPKLASKCGSRYMKIVQRFLDAPNALIDKPGTIEAAQYLLQLVKDLALCCMLDEQGQPSDLDIDVFEALIAEQIANTPLTPETKPRKSPVSPIKTVTTHGDPQTARSRARRRTQHHQQPSHNANAAAALKKYPDIPIPQQHLNEWNTLLMPKLSRILNNVLKGSNESASVSLMMLGSTPEQARTTICVQCTDTAKMREMLCQRFRPKRGWGVIIVKGDIRRSGRRRTAPRKTRTNVARRSAGPGSGILTEEIRTKQQEYQKRPGPGASIGAFKEGEHLPPVSFGGTVIVDGETYGLTVHHMLDDPSDESEGDGDGDSDEEEEEEEEQEEEEGVDDDCFPEAGLSTRQAKAEIEDSLIQDIHRSMAPRQHDEKWRRDLNEVKKQLGFEDDPLSQIDHTAQAQFPDDGNDEGYDSESDASTIRPDYSIVDDAGQEFWFMNDSDMPELDYDEEDGAYLLSDDDEDEDNASIGDTPGIAPFTVDDEDLCITQPALDDVDDDFFPSLEDRDDDHLTSHGFGYVHASSGIRRIANGGLKHEVDWALIRINEDRRRLLSESRASSKARVSRSRSSTSSSIMSATTQEPQLTAISSAASLPNRRVTCIARTSGARNGRISPAMSLVKFHGRTSFSHSFTVEGGFGVPGDSGAWIWSEEDNELCGHVLAWGNSLQVAFMAPMEVLLEDIKKTLNVEKVQLPMAAASEMVSTHRNNTKGKQVVEIVQGHVESKVSHLNRDLDQARELEVALRGLHVDEVAEDRRSTFDQSSNSMDREIRDVQIATSIQRVDVRSTSTTNSSATSGYTRFRGMTGEERIDISPPSLPRQNRFDIHVGTGSRGGGSNNEIQSLPMARALS